MTQPQESTQTLQTTAGFLAAYMNDLLPLAVLPKPPVAGPGASASTIGVDI